MNRDEQRKVWTELRYNYYTSARLLISEAMMDMAWIMFHYAIESSLKAIVFECTSNEIHQAYKRVRNSHNLNELSDFIIEHGICENLPNPRYFLKSIFHRFNRYPSQVHENTESWIKSFGHITHSVAHCPFFDDLILKIDTCLSRQFNLKETSLGVKALLEYPSNKSRIFFHMNSRALNNLIRYSELTEVDVNEEWNIEELVKFKTMNTWWIADIENPNRFDCNKYSI